MTETEEIKQKINIADLVADYVELKKAGVNFKARCPFHEEKTPSFVVSPVKQIWHCFGCGMGGDIFEFIKEIEGIDFPEAIRMLASRAGVRLENRSFQNYAASKDEKSFDYEINEWAAKFYEKILFESQSAGKARDYLVKRGLSPETIKKWRIGYAPDEFHTFEEFIVKKGFQKSEAVKAGLLSSNERGFFDRFHDRVMFPLFDIHDRVVGFTARTLKQDSNIAKYVNSPETKIYNKSELLYGLNFAKTEIRKKDQVIVVEGNMDVITAHEAGYENVVGSSGTALTEGQLDKLFRFTENISFAFDVDEAGLSAARRAVQSALQKGFLVKIIQIPREIAKDPDELIRKDVSEWERSIEKQESFLDFYFREIFDKLDTNKSEHKKQAVKGLLPLISFLPDPIDRSHYLNRLAYETRVDEKILIDVLEKQMKAGEKGVNTQEKISDNRERRTKSTRAHLEEKVLGLLLAFPVKLKDGWEQLSEEDFIRDDLRKIFLAGKDSVLSGALDLSDKIFDQKQREEIELMVFATENELDALPMVNLDGLKQEYIFRLRAENIKKAMNQLSAEIRTAEVSGDEEQVKELSIKFNELSKQLNEYRD